MLCVAICKMVGCTKVLDLVSLTIRGKLKMLANPRHD